MCWLTLPSKTSQTSQCQQDQPDQPSGPVDLARGLLHVVSLMVNFIPHLVSMPAIPVPVLQNMVETNTWPKDFNKYTCC